MIENNSERLHEDIDPRQFLFDRDNGSGAGNGSSSMSSGESVYPIPSMHSVAQPSNSRVSLTYAGGSMKMEGDAMHEHIEDSEDLDHEYDEKDPHQKLISAAQDAVMSMIDIALDSLLDKPEDTIRGLYGTTREQMEDVLPLLVAKHVLQATRTHQLIEEFQVSQFEIRKDLESFLVFLEQNTGDLEGAIGTVVSEEDLEDHEFES